MNYFNKINMLLKWFKIKEHISIETYAIIILSTVYLMLCPLFHQNNHKNNNENLSSAWFH